MEMKQQLLTMTMTAPFPAGAITAMLPASVIRRRPLTGMAASAVAGGGWFVSPLLGLLGLSVALAWVTWTGSSRRSRDVLALIVGASPWVAFAAMKEWVDPGSMGLIGWAGRHPIVLAAGCAGVLVVGAVLRRVFRPALDPLRHATPEMRKDVIRRDGNHCAWCGAKGDDLGVRLECDHVVPWSKGGRTETSNLQMLCGPCNGLKGNKSDDDGRKAFAKLHGYAAGSFPKNWFEKLIY